MLKRLFDIMFSFLGLIMVSPLFGLIAILIKRNSKGPVFYRGKRVGKDGKLFKVFKFRTMVTEAENLGGPSTADDDPRITGIGKFLRKFKLDELPELINVVIGEMSLVGPRPEVLEEVETYTQEQKEVLKIKPGLTDFASLWNFQEGEILKGSKNPHQTYQEKIKPEKLRLQLEYLKKQSFWVDLKIILLTFKKIIFK